MQRRAFIVGLGATALPIAARAQQGTPAIAVFNSGRPAAQAKNMAALRQGLKDADFIEGQNVAIQFYWGENQFDRLPALAAEVIARRPALIVSNGLAALRAKAVTTAIPIVFTTGSDPVRDGLVGSVSRPGGNITGVVFLAGIVGSKRLELLRQLVPKANTIAMIFHPGTTETEAERKDVETAARTIGRQVIFLDVRSTADLEAAFPTLASRGVDAALIGAGAFIFNNLRLLVASAARHAIPAMYSNREAVDAGGLMAYGASQSDAFRQAGRYAGRILKGEKPGDLPVVQSSKFDFVINLNTAKALGLEFHPQLLATADEVIE